MFLRIAARYYNLIYMPGSHLSDIITSLMEPCSCCLAWDILLGDLKTEIHI